ncbi:DEHA2C15972p [Debaryomyces hansenii CBS767]|uniref:DEHA2C15972p n=1 Tax=Debaryomyces hansenii (strain ATCC 36239 / CBS 767 / BCRC 21394 / JCM 1990 / NBRC 0083 / IGC 2968) TaxID=284592 RepID=Q6BTT8_DEBHA|nr:DEHA2C15972p [Debaryomyces hansenii CBS767]CAG86463.2 DEHA2C15972p [Debaryomyces hansenii CBS767]|eukprot:XP_458381.2 DEHA2C15972p [Debaryomyces hansenii CBS767]
MSNQGTIYSIPNSKKPTNNKLPNLLIPSPVSINKSDQTYKQPRRKPPPIDFSRIHGAYSNTPDTISPNPSSGTHSGIQSATSDISENLRAHNIGNNTKQNNEQCKNNEQSKNNNDEIQKRVEDLSPDDWNRLANDNQIIELNKLGEGNGGSVSKCTLVNGSQIFALKLINADPNPNIQKQIIRELQYNRVCDSPNIVKYYGTFMVEKQSMIGISMEYMGGRSLDAIYKRVIELDPTNRINEKVLGKVAESILTGLNYLHQQRIIHRDIKPSNILLDSEGNIKLCDFGVSGEVVNSLATTFVGTQYYMAPERIMGKPYTVSCDIWSLGLTLLEVAICKFPFITDDTMVGPIELLSLILEYEPKLNDIPEQGIFWSDSFKNFIGYCLKKNSEERPSPRQMLSHPWCVSQSKIKVRMDKFVKKLWGQLD